MTAKELRIKFLNFFEKRGHRVVPSSSLIPDDPSVLLTTAGMQQFKKYYTGDADPIKDFGKKNTVSVQKSFRTSDIDEVGDDTHHTFFEMLGNFSFGGYFKKEAITYAYDFITKELGLSISYVTIFEGSDIVPKDEESRTIWTSLGIEDVREEGVQDVFWGPTGASGPCGPTTEIYCKNAAGQDVEIWNIVFNEYFSQSSRDTLLNGTGSLIPLETRGIDTGAGFERLVATVQKAGNNYETDLFAPLLELLPQEMDIRHKRIVVDHLRASVFLLADGVRPSNKDRGYILRRLMRRAMVYEYMYKIPPHVFDAFVHDVVHEYGEFYSELMRENEIIREEFSKEKQKFGKTLQLGMKEVSAIKGDEVSAESAFKLYESYGLPYEIIKELAGEKARDLTREGFDKEFQKHQEISRAGQERKFGGHGLILDTGELKAADERELKIVTRLHTATHLLNAALHKVLGEGIEQAGSDITVERTRFDFTFPRKVTPEEIKKIEELVNYAITRDFPVKIAEMSTEEAKNSGALFFKKGKYPAKVKVYTIGDEKEVFSKELCGGPHVQHTGEIERFRVTKEEASSAGVRRIRGVIG